MTLATTETVPLHNDETSEHLLARLGAQVRTERERRHGTTLELASLLDLEDSDIHDIENGQRPLTPPQLVKISQAFKLDVEHFVTPFRLIDNEVLAWSQQGPSMLFPVAQGSPLVSRLSLFQWLRSKTHIGRVSHPVFGRNLRLPAHPLIADVERLADRLRSFWSLDGQLQTLQDALREELHIQVLWLNDTTQNHEQPILGVLARLDQEDVLVLRPTADLQRLAEVMAQALFHLTTAGTLAWWKPETRAWGEVFAARFLQDAKSVALPMEAHEGDVFGSPLMVNMLHEALDCSFLSARKAADLMHMPLEDLTKAFERCGMKSPFGF